MKVLDEYMLELTVTVKESYFCLYRQLCLNSDKKIETPNSSVYKCPQSLSTLHVVVRSILIQPGVRLFIIPRLPQHLVHELSISNVHLAGYAITAIAIWMKK